MTKNNIKKVKEVAKDLSEFTSTKWHGIPRYDCPHCRFDSIDPDSFRSHLLTHLRRKKKKTEDNSESGKPK